ncbi:MAG: peptide chain release factor N(5)-glutamine methyltransferase [Patescibacteria group bacterium]|jgi:release factor glutamine methyltransferase
MSNISKILNDATKRLKSKSSSPTLDAEILLAHVLKKPKEFILIHPETVLTKKQISNLQFLISKRKTGEPIAYLTGHKEFYGLDFIVNRHVLVPRPETELLVEETLKIINANYQPPITIADIGTGSGCVAITIATKSPNAKIYATDISSLALTVAKKNSAEHKTTKQLIFKRGSLLSPLQNIKLDIIVANLPYLDKKMKNLLRSTETRGLKFEPTLALYAGDKGLDKFKKFFSQLAKRKQQPNFVLLEIGHNQGRVLQKLCTKYLPGYKTTIKKDLCDFDRVLILKKII